MPNTITVERFLTGKSLEIPAYQRDYAWTLDQVQELIDDVRETVEGQTSHYLGTIVLAGKRNVFAIVDGQQRLSTLMLMLRALLVQLDENNSRRIADETNLLKTDEHAKLDFGNNQKFMDGVFAHRNPIPRTRGQRQLAQAYQYCYEWAYRLSNEGSHGVYHWLKAVKQLEIIEFIEEDAGRAIRIFQSVNDRGRPLGAMDKAKALLVLYSNQFLRGDLDKRINEVFGACFAAYDRIRDRAEQRGYEIDLINRGGFSEDDLLRYHYLSYDCVGFYDPEGIPEAKDYYGSVHTVLDSFLKSVLLRKKGCEAELCAFILDYIEDLEEFAKSFADMVEEVRQSRRLFMMLVVHKLAARLYPLTIRLFQRGLLFEVMPGATSDFDLMQCIETVDLRVYKIRGTDPAKNIGYLAHASRTATISDVAAHLREFLTRFMSDDWMRIFLAGRMYRNGSVVPILLGFEQASIPQPYSLERLVLFKQEGLTEEHILSQEPSYDVISLGFSSQAEFEEHKDKIGNLLLLTASENSRCGNNAPGVKTSQTNLYPSSTLAGPRLIAQKFHHTGAVFNKEAVLERTAQLTQYAINRWAIW